MLELRVAVPIVPFTGETSQSEMYRSAAGRIASGYVVGGSNLTAAVVGLLENLAASIDGRPQHHPGTPTTVILPQLSDHAAAASRCSAAAKAIRADGLVTGSTRAQTAIGMLRATARALDHATRNESGPGSPKTLDQFVLDRVDEAELAANQVESLGVTHDMGGHTLPHRFIHSRLTYAGADGMPQIVNDRAAEDHFSRHDPARVLAECDSKRRIVEGYRLRNEQAEHQSGEVFGYHATGMYTALRWLAVPDAAHPDYDERWRP
jgi:hypothetical protein